MNHPPAPSRHARRWRLLQSPAAELERARHVERLWRWPVVAALLATIPAFYAEMLEGDQIWANLIYGAAGLAIAAALAHTGWHTSRPRAHAAENVLDLLLIPGLLAAALVPASADSAFGLAARLAVALLTLVRVAWALHHWVTRGGVVYLMAVAFGVLLLCGAGFWWLEPRTPTLADGLWLAFTTAATVGYGDIVPSTPASRIFSVFVVLLGYGVLTLATAALATAWIETQERRIEREILHDLHRQVAGLRKELAELRVALPETDPPRHPPREPPAE